MYEAREEAEVPSKLELEIPKNQDSSKSKEETRFSQEGDPTKSFDSPTHSKRVSTQPQHQARVGTKSISGSPMWERKISSEGSNGGAPSTPSRSRLSQVTLGIDSPYDSTAVPVFGDWDDNDPASAEGYPHIFNKVREERHGGGGKSPRITRENSYFYGQRPEPKKDILYFICVILPNNPPTTTSLVTGNHVYHIRLTQINKFRMRIDGPDWYRFVKDYAIMLKTILHFQINNPFKLSVVEYHTKGNQPHIDYTGQPFLGTPKYFTTFHEDTPMYQDLHNSFLQTIDFQQYTKHAVYTHVRVYDVDVLFEEAVAVGLCGPPWQKLCADLKIIVGHYLIFYYIMEGMISVTHFDQAGRESYQVMKMLTKLLKKIS